MSAINIEKAIENYREFLEVVNKRMEMAGEGNCVPTTVFAKEISPQFDVEWSVSYNLMKFIVASDENLELKKGPHGGMRSIKKIEEVATKIEE